MSRRPVLTAVKLAGLAALTIPLVAGCVSNDTAGSDPSSSAPSSGSASPSSSAT